ncbi:MAG TPA: diguanylate cyclase [Terriglobales bacterium]|jgi:diguanylate cyclase (GGDEF)-like protein/PAS domain S-box-containing protein|nr:diguanylate cyclase [Terriglobales bacterium]
MSEVRDPEVFRAVLDSLPVGVYIEDRNGTILFWNQSAERITGHRRYEVIGHSQRENILAQCDGQCCPGCGKKCPFQESSIDGREQELRLSLRHKNGHPVAVVFRINPVRNPQGAVNYLVGSFEEPHATARTARDRRPPVPTSGVDETTGVANHGFVEFHLRENLAGLAEYHVPFGIMCLQLDRFEHLRSTYGRQATDTMLRVVAETLRNSLRPSDVLGHWGEDQFLAVLPNCGGRGAEIASERLQKLVAGAGIHWWGEQLSIVTSIGFAGADMGDTVGSLVERAQHSLKPVPADKKSAAGAGTSARDQSSGS